MGPLPPAGKERLHLLCCGWEARGPGAEDGGWDLVAASGWLPWRRGAPWKSLLVLLSAPPVPWGLLVSVWALRLQGQMTMTLSDTMKIIVLQDLCWGGGIGKHRGLFEPFSFLDLKIKALKRMESSKWEYTGRSSSTSWEACFVYFLGLLFRWDVACRNLPSPFCCGFMGILNGEWFIICLHVPQFLPEYQCCFHWKQEEVLIPSPTSLTSAEMPGHLFSGRPYPGCLGPGH